MNTEVHSIYWAENELLKKLLEAEEAIKDEKNWLSLNELKAIMESVTNVANSN